MAKYDTFGHVTSRTTMGRGEVQSRDLRIQLVRIQIAQINALRFRIVTHARRFLHEREHSSKHGPACFSYITGGRLGKRLVRVSLCMACFHALLFFFSLIWDMWARKLVDLDFVYRYERPHRDIMIIESCKCLFSKFLSIYSTLYNTLFIDCHSRYYSFLFIREKEN